MKRHWRHLRPVTARDSARDWRLWTEKKIWSARRLLSQDRNAPGGELRTNTGSVIDPVGNDYRSENKQSLLQRSWRLNPSVFERDHLGRWKLGSQYQIVNGAATKELHGKPHPGRVRC